ncbi:MAG: DUF2314 domain-containing protein [Methanoregulaceae archaeon]|nr:DUF2314 domain-containing protein [Methanoregulaceae archaeon]
MSKFVALLAALIVVAVAVVLVIGQGAVSGMKTSQTVDQEGRGAAVAMAKRRLPEFLEAFAKHGSTGKFAVCAKVTKPEGVENVWIRLGRYENGQFHGRLDVDPMELKGVKKGDEMSVDQASVVDWMYDIGGGPEGGFTLKIPSS